MIRLILGWFSKNKLAKWLKARQDEIRKEYTDKEQSLVSELESKFVARQKKYLTKSEEFERQERNLADLEKRVNDRKIELERCNEELKLQIRMIEAKASPDNVWVTAFSQGYSKAWDTMLPFMTQGIEKVKETIKNNEIEDSLKRLEPMIQDRLNSLGNPKLIETYDLMLKRKEFSSRLSPTTLPEERLKLESYLKILDWLLGVRNGN